MSSNKPVTVDLFKNISLPRAIGVILLISTVSVGFLIWLIYFQGGDDYSSNLISSLPALNSLLNGMSFVLLLFGFRAIRQQQYSRHMKFNLTAFVTSSLFLISYVICHTYHGSTPFTGEGIIRPIYFFILITHIILSALVMPLILTSFYLAFSGNIKLHRKVSKVTLPVWLYVSVTGIAVFFLLRAHS